MDKAFVVVSMLMMAGGVHLPYAANATKGKVLFERSHLGGGTMGKSCITCHDGGKRLGGDLFKPKTIDHHGEEQGELARWYQWAASNTTWGVPPLTLGVRKCKT